MSVNTFQVKASLRQIVNCSQISFSQHATIKNACKIAIDCIDIKDAEIKALKLKIAAFEANKAHNG